MSVRVPTVGYKLDEASGIAVATYGGVNLTDNNTVTSAVGNIYATARQFTRANSESLSAADAAIFSTGDIDFGVYCWAYFDSSGTQQMLVTKGNGGSSSAAAASEFLLQRYTDNKVYLTMGPGSGTSFGEVASAATVSAGAWHWIAVWHDSVNNTVNVSIDNGAAQTLAYSLGGCDNAEAFRIGADAGGRYMDGRIQQVMLTKGFFYNSTERTALYNSGSGLAFDATAPTVTAASINAAGTTLSVTFSEAVTGFSAADCTLSGGAALGAASGSGAGPYTMAITPAVQLGQVRTLSYTGTATVDTSGWGNALATFSGAAVTNGSTQAGGSLPTVLAMCD